MDTQILQTVFMGIGLIVSIVTMIFVVQIGIRQNSINEQALNLNDYAEVFLMPKPIVMKTPNVPDKVVAWKVLITNASAYPVYLNSFTINGVNHEVGNSVIPNNPDNWFEVSIPADVLIKKEFSISIKFEDYRGNKYQTDGFGLFDGNGWSVTSKKRVPIQ